MGGGTEKGRDFRLSLPGLELEVVVARIEDVSLLMLFKVGLMRVLSLQGRGERVTSPDGVRTCIVHCCC